MASDRQIAANRNNAKKSTGPRTMVGCARSSHNAFRHGLAIPARVGSSEVNSMAVGFAGSLFGQGAAADDLEQLALALYELSRIRETRAALLNQLDDPCDSDQRRVLLEQTARLERYERRARHLWRSSLRLMRD